MKTRYLFIRLCVLAVCTVLLLAGCGAAKSSSLPDMPGMGEIIAISREEGSGTRAEFETTIKTTSAGTDKIASSTNEVAKLVTADKNAIGYLSYSSVRDVAGVTVLAVDGISPNEKTLKKETYPLCRNYYLAYSGTPRAVTNDFLRYVQTAGQDIVAKYALSISASSTFLSDRSAGQIKIVGSSSVAPLIEALAAKYESINTNAKITITVSDSTNGLTAAMQGKCDMAMSSRRLRSYEDELLTKKVIARDGIAVIVNSGSPLTDLSSDNIRKIYDNAVSAWTELK